MSQPTEKAKKVKKAIFPCIGRDEHGDPCQRETHKGICDVRGRCSKHIREALEDLYPKTVLRGDEDLKIFLKDAALYGRLTSDPPEETVTAGRILYQRLVDACVKYQQNVSVATSADALRKQLDFVRPRFDRYTLPIPGFSCPQADADGEACREHAFVCWEGFCCEHSTDAQECCEDIAETYEKYVTALKKWARLGTPRCLQTCRVVHADILRELVGGAELPEPAGSPVHDDPPEDGGELDVESGGRSPDRQSHDKDPGVATQKEAHDQDPSSPGGSPSPLAGSPLPQAPSVSAGVCATDDAAVRLGQCGTIYKRGSRIVVCHKDPTGHCHKDSSRPTQVELDRFKAG